MTRLGDRSDRQFGDDGAAFGDGTVELVMLRRVDDVDAAGDDSDRAGGEAAPVRGVVDAAGETGGDGKSGGAEVAGDVFGEAPAVGGGRAGTDDGDGLPIEQGEVAKRAK